MPRLHLPLHLYRILGCFLLSVSMVLSANSVLAQTKPDWQQDWWLANQTQQCEAMQLATSYLKKSLQQARARLHAVDGFEQVRDVKICRLDYGNPFSDRNNNRIYIRDWRSENDRVTLWHEYLHLALRFHPNGSNETYIETLAQQLAQVRVSGM